ncbi:hypothetical protein QQF64_014846 [Cirrhinus molitorella]|uniref:Uncharacterized protein n=1 Tax=Cirrhinus molitorella TaxID=172907 RepID=A0ABR3NTY4_9TELE
MTLITQSAIDALPLALNVTHDTSVSGGNRRARLRPSPPTCVTGAGYCDQSRNQDGEALGRQGDRKSLFIGKLQRQAAWPTPAGNDMFIGSE